MKDMYEMERKLAMSGKQFICGVDEAGCGPLAGPVYAAAVMLAPGDEIEGINDSKKLSEKRREQLFLPIKQRALAWAVARVDEKDIDRLNILEARLLAMRMAVDAISGRVSREGVEYRVNPGFQGPDIALVDGNRDPGLNIETLLLVKGDTLSASIAAASILAKVSRDRAMLELDALYPEYMFKKHKGYPTKLHYEMLEKHGVCPAHRVSFLKKFFEKSGPCLKGR